MNASAGVLCIIIVLRPRLHGIGRIWDRAKIRPFLSVYTRIRLVRGSQNSSGFRKKEVMFVCSFLEKYVQRRIHGRDKNSNTFPCPKCRSVFTLKSSIDLANNHFIKNMLEIMATQREAKASTACSRCLDPAINHCATCEMFMCKKCSEWHDTWPAIKNHNVLSVEELCKPESRVNLRRKLYCMIHEDQILEYYCETCKELSCIHCLVLYHQKQNHSCVAVSEIAQKRRERLQSCCTALDEKLSEGKEALTNIGEVMKSLKKNAETAKGQIKEQKENILKIVAEKLDERAKKMNEEVDMVYGEFHNELSKQMNEIIQFLDKIQASLSLPRNLLKRGSIEEIISSQKLIDENIRKLKSDQPESLATVNDGGIQYVPGGIGNINVDEILGKLEYVQGMYKYVNSVLH